MHQEGFKHALGPPGGHEGVEPLMGSDGRVPHEQLAETVGALQREKEIVEVLYRVAEAVVRQNDLSEIVQVVTDETTALTGAQFGAFFYNVLRADGEAYMLYTLAGAEREAFERFPMPRATDIFRPTFEGTGIVRMDDVTVDHRFGHNSPYNGLPPGHLPVRSYLAVPVTMSDGEVAGGLFFGHEDAGVFSPEHERIAVGIAAHAGIAIEKARLLEAERSARSEAQERAAAALALEYVADAVVMVDSFGSVRYWNPAATRIFGFAPDEATGRTIGDVVEGWERIALSVPIGGEQESARPRTLPVETRTGERWLSTYGVSFAHGTVYAFRDTTEEHELERMRSELTATVSHELRTPIAAVYGAAQTLRRSTLEPEVTAELLDVLLSESRRLASLIEEFLLAGQIESGRISLREDVVDPAGAVELAARAARAAGLAAEVVIDAPTALPSVCADAGKLGEVLGNLVDNAGKYGAADAADAIRIRLHGDRRVVRFEVADNGPGIPAREQERIFEKFYRLDPQMKGGVSGTGLGLYICRELIERMGGRIGVESAVGEGSTFWFELPQAAVSSTEPDPVSVAG